MLNEKLLEKLRKNWIDFHDDGFVESRLIVTPRFSIYLYGLDENDMLKGLFESRGYYVLNDISITDIEGMFNEDGEKPYLDPEFRRIKVSALIKRLIDGTHRNI